MLRVPMTHSDPATSAPHTPPAPAAYAVTEEQVRQVAALANLELSPAELPAMQRDLNAILGYIAELNELDTASVEAMSQVSEILHTDIAASSDAALRQDMPVASLDRGAVLHSAPETDGVFFKLPRVMER